MKKPTIIGFIPKKVVKKNDKNVDKEKKENLEPQQNPETNEE